MNTRIQAAVDEIDGQIARLTECRRSLTALFGEGQGTAPAVLVQTSELDTAGQVRRELIKAAWKKAAKRRPRKRAEETERTEGTDRSNRTQRTNGLTPLSAEMIAAAGKLQEPFGTEHLRAATGCEQKLANNTVTRWRVKKWIERTGRGEYRRTKLFGNTGSEPAGETPAVPAKENGDGRRPTLQPAPAAPAATEEKLTPYSAKGIAIGKSLKKEFTVDELGALLPLGKQAAYYWIGQWRNRNWIEKRDYDVYRKTEEFGTGGGG